MFVNIKDVEKNPSVSMNFALGSIRCIGLFTRVNLKPSTNLRDKSSSLRLPCCSGFQRLSDEFSCGIHIYNVVRTI